jgi:putative toxin-antitoxin system antitoxin component (TIGR02293 family)
MAQKKDTRQTAKKAAGGKSSQLAETAVAYQVRPARPLDYLGGRSAGLNTSIMEGQELIELIKKGIPRKSLDYLIIHTGLTPLEMAGIMHTTDRTLRRYKPSKLLNPEQSERVIEIARLYSRGQEVFETLPAFKLWMERSLLSLGNRPPKEFLDTSMGIELLMDELGRIEQGVFS